MKQFGNNLVKAFNKLTQSSTRLTRKRARSQFRSATNAILKHYRPILADGTLAEPKPHACVCPLCDTSIKYWSSLRDHLSNHHKIYITVSQKSTYGTPKHKQGAPTTYNEFRCFGCNRGFVGLSGLAKHLSHVKRKGEWKNHVVQAAMKAQFTQGGSNP